MTDKAIVVRVPDDNVFERLGLPDAEADALRVDRGVALMRVIEASGLTQQEVARELSDRKRRPVYGQGRNDSVHPRTIRQASVNHG